MGCENKVKERHRDRYGNGDGDWEGSMTRAGVSSEAEGRIQVSTGNQCQKEIDWFCFKQSNTFSISYNYQIKNYT